MQRCKKKLLGIIENLEVIGIYKIKIFDIDKKFILYNNIIDVKSHYLLLIKKIKKLFIPQLKLYIKENLEKLDNLEKN